MMALFTAHKSMLSQSPLDSFVATIKFRNPRRCIHLLNDIAIKHALLLRRDVVLESQGREAEYVKGHFWV